MNKKKYTAFAVCTAALAALIYGVPAIENTLLMLAAGTLCIVVMAACVFVGKLDDLGGADNG